MVTFVFKNQSQSLSISGWYSLRSCMWLVYFPEGIYVDKPLSRPHELMLLKFLHGHENILLANGHKIIYKLGIIQLPVQFSVQSFFFMLIEIFVVFQHARRQIAATRPGNKCHPVNRIILLKVFSHVLYMSHKIKPTLATCLILCGDCLGVKSWCGGNLNSPVQMMKLILLRPIAAVSACELSLDCTHHYEICCRNGL